jgi:hypothetical protein
MWIRGELEISAAKAIQHNPLTAGSGQSGPRAIADTA